MVAACFDKLCLLLRKAFHKDDTEKGISMLRFFSIVRAMRLARLLLQKFVDESEGNANDHLFVQACARAMTLYKESDEVRSMNEAVQKYEEEKACRWHMNTCVIDTLSYNLHMKHNVSFIYIHNRIWARIEYKVNDTLSSLWEHEMWNILVDMEIDKEDRILPSLEPPMFSAYQNLQLQNCLKQIHDMCLQLPGELKCKVCNYISADYTICPEIAVDIYQYTRKSVDCCGKVEHVVAKALKCGIGIDRLSVFWILCRMNELLHEWTAESVYDDDSILHDFQKFPEIDQLLIEKIKAMIIHKNWNQGNV